MRSFPYAIRGFGAAKKSSIRSLNSLNTGDLQLSANEAAQFVTWDAVFNLAFNVLLALALSRVLALVFAKLAEASAPPPKLPAEQWDAMVRPPLKPALAASFNLSCPSKYTLHGACAHQAFLSSLAGPMQPT